MNNDYFGDRYWLQEGDYEDLKTPDEYQDEKESPYKLLKSLPEGKVNVLLGAAGMGKTFELGKEYQRLESEASSKCIKILLGSEGYYSLKDKLENLVLQPIKKGEKVYLFLDALDETGDDFKSITSLIKSKLDQIPESFTLYLSCRTTFWPKRLENFFREKVGKRFQKLTLHPLSETDIVRSAERFGITWEKAYELSKEVKFRNLQFMASTPLTLIMLLKEYQKNHKLPESRIALLKEGLLRLAKESNEQRVEECATGNLTNEERLRLAGRVAIMTLFSGKLKIHTGEASEIDQETELTLSELQEQKIIENHCGREITVDLKNLKEVCATALFIPVGEHTFRWAHKEFEEHAACQYAQQNGLQAEEILKLVCSSEFPEQPVIPRFYSFCSSIAFYNKEFCWHLCEKQPELLLHAYSDLNEEPEYRKRLLQYRLEEVEKPEAVQTISKREWDSQRYHQLNHPKISEQLKSYFHRDNQKILEELIIIVTTLNLRDLEDEIAILVYQQRLNTNCLYQASKWIGDNEESVHTEGVLDQMLNLIFQAETIESIHCDIGLLLLNSGRKKQKIKLGELFQKENSSENNHESHLQHLALRAQLECRQITDVEFFNHLKLSTRWKVDESWLKNLITHGSLDCCIAALFFGLRLIEVDKVEREKRKQNKSNLLFGSRIFPHGSLIITIMNKAWQYLEEEQLRVPFAQIFIEMTRFSNPWETDNNTIDKEKDGSIKQDLMDLLCGDETKRKSFFLTLFNTENSLIQKPVSPFNRGVMRYRCFHIEEDFLWYLEQAMKTESPTVKAWCGSITGSSQFKPQQIKYHNHPDLIELYTKDYHFSKSCQNSSLFRKINYLPNFLESLRQATPSTEEEEFWAEQIRNIWPNIYYEEVREFFQEILEDCRQRPCLAKKFSDLIDLEHPDPIENLFQQWDREEEEEKRRRDNLERMKDLCLTDSTVKFLEALRWASSIIGNCRWNEEYDMIESIKMSSKKRLPDLVKHDEFFLFLCKLTVKDYMVIDIFSNIETTLQCELITRLLQYKPIEEFEDAYFQLFADFYNQFEFKDFQCILSLEQIERYDQKSFTAILYLLGEFESYDREDVQKFWKENQQIVDELVKKGAWDLVKDLSEAGNFDSSIQLDDISYLVNLLDQTKKEAEQQNLVSYLSYLHEDFYNKHQYIDKGDFILEECERIIWEGCQKHPVLHQAFVKLFPLDVPDPYQHYLDEIKRVRDARKKRIGRSERHHREREKKKMLRFENEIAKFQKDDIEVWVQLNALFYLDSKNTPTWKGIRNGMKLKKERIGETPSEKNTPYLADWNCFNAEQRSQVVEMAATYLKQYDQGDIQKQFDGISTAISDLDEEELDQIKVPYIAGYDAMMLLFLHGKELLAMLFHDILKKWFDCLFEIAGRRLQLRSSRNQYAGFNTPKKEPSDIHHFHLIEAIREIDTQMFDDYLIKRANNEYWLQKFWDTSLSKVCLNTIKRESTSPFFFTKLFLSLLKNEKPKAIDLAQSFLRDYIENEKEEHKLLSTERLTPNKVTNSGGGSFDNGGFLSQTTKKIYNPKLLQTEKWIIIAELVLQHNFQELYEHIWPVIERYPSIGIKLFRNHYYVSNEFSILQRLRFFCWIVDLASVYDDYEEENQEEFWTGLHQEQLNAIFHDQDTTLVLVALQALSERYPDEGWSDLIKTVQERHLRKNPTFQEPKKILSVLKNHQLTQRGEEEFFPDNETVNEKINKALLSAEDDLKRENPVKSIHGVGLVFESLVKSTFPTDDNFQFWTLGGRNKRKNIREAFREKSNLPEFLFEFIFLINDLRNCVPGAGHESCALIEVPFSIHEATLFLELARATVWADANMKKRPKTPEESVKRELQVLIDKEHDTIRNLLSRCFEWKELYNIWTSREKSMTKGEKIHSTVREIYEKLEKTTDEIFSWFDANSKSSYSNIEYNRFIQANELLKALVETSKRIHRS